MEHSDCHESAAWLKTKDLLFESFSTNGEFSMEIWAGEIIPVVTENYEFDYRDLNNIEHFLSFLTIGIMMEGTNLIFFQRN